MITRILILAVLVIALISGMAFFVHQQNAGEPNVALTDAQQAEIDQILAEAAAGNSGVDALIDEAAQDDAGTTADAEGDIAQDGAQDGDSTPAAGDDAAVAGTSTASAAPFVSTAQAAAPVTGSWKLVAFDKESWDIDDEDDDVGEIRYKKDVCKQMKDSLRVPVECRKTSKLKRDSAASLGNDKCADSCSIGASCVLWNSDEKRDGSLTLNIANYMCS
jgi:hypothetical protein